MLTPFAIVLELLFAIEIERSIRHISMVNSAHAVGWASFPWIKRISL